MSTVHRETAKIYAFPARQLAGEMVLGGKRPIGAFDPSHGTISHLSDRRIAASACGSAWYHEAEIEQAARERNLQS